MLIFVISLLCCHIFLNNAAILHCDFETDCFDFIFDSNWGLTDGNHSQGIDHDHTLNTSAGHYRYYNPLSIPRGQWAQIQTANSLSLSENRSLCFSMWYFTSRVDFPFSIQVGQGDDGQLTRVLFSTSGKNVSTNDWTLINVTLPSEELKIFIRMNVTSQPLTFDDFSVEYCDGASPVPPKMFDLCDFESSCRDDFVSLTQYAYQWSILNASEAVKINRAAPAVDFTFGNASGHYALIWNVSRGLGFLHAQKQIEITSNESYCLNFRYYGTQGPNRFQAYLSIYSWKSNETKTIEKLWPTGDLHKYEYTFNRWTWGAVSLPTGNYSLLFRVFNGDFYPSTFAIDNIAIVSCDYSPFPTTSSLLSFSCDFDHSSTCGMTNGARSSKNVFNFTLSTGETIPNKNLGPTRDHTTNSTSGGFLYWNRQFPLTSTDLGTISTTTAVTENFNLCIKFAYYVKSTLINQNATNVLLLGSGFPQVKWFRSLDDSQGWQIAVVPVNDYLYDKTFSLYVNQTQSVPVSVAFDDVEMDQCSTFTPTTTTTTTITTTLTTTTSPTTSTTPATTSTTVTKKTSTTAPTTPSSAHRLMFFNEINFIIIFCALIIVFKNISTK